MPLDDNISFSYYFMMIKGFEDKENELTNG